MTFEKARHYGALSGQSQSSSAKWTYAFDFERRLARAESQGNCGPCSSPAFNQFGKHHGGTAFLYLS
jgi:hypothetical protein